LQEHAQGNWNVEYRILRPDGSVRWIQDRGFPIRDENGALNLMCGVAADITQRKQAEAALQASETKYSRLVEGAPDIIYTFSNQRGGLYYSSHAEAVLGYSVKHLLEHPLLWQNSIEPAALEGIRLALQKYATGEPFDLEYRIKDSAGRWHWLRDRSIGCRQVGDDLIIEGIATDITASKQAEEALRESEHRFRGMFENVADGILLVSLDGHVRDANPAACRMNGYPHDEFVGKHGSEFVHPEHVWKVRASLAAIQAGQTYAAESVNLRKDGTPLPIEVHIAPFTHRGEAVLLCSIRDITQRQQAEAALRASEAKLRSVIDCSPVPLAINDEQGNITYVNREFTKTYGYALGDIPTLAAWWQKAYPDPTYQAEVKTSWQLRLNQTLQEGTAFEAAEVNIRCQDGSQRIALDGAAPLTGIFAGTHLVVLYDITARKKAETALRQKAEALRASNAELELFNRAMIGRELRMIELKQEINELCRRLGEPPRHETDPLPTDDVPGAGPAPAGGGGA
jgi:PAS domain S-box-containing protein